MDIVPLVYTALIVVLVLAIITIITSYLSLRKKSRQTFTTAEAKSEPQPENLVIPQVEIPLKKQVRASKSKTKYLQKEKKVSAKKPKENVVLHKIKVDTNEQKRNAKIESRKSLKLTKRVEVLNGSIFDKNAFAPREDKNKKIRQTMVSAKTKVGTSIESYEDENAGDMYTLKVNDSKGTPKNKS
jgi:inner membrane protein involved in colicin E2 resistance